MNKKNQQKLKKKSKKLVEGRCFTKDIKVHMTLQSLEL